MSTTYLLIRHLTRFIYSEPIQENMMSVWLRPLDDERQHCHAFKLSVKPTVAIADYVDTWGNTVHHFDIPSPHDRLEIASETTVGVQPGPVLPQHLRLEDWDEIDRMAQGDFWHFSHASHFAQQTALLKAFSAELNLTHDTDPLTLLHRINSALYHGFAYDQAQTKVDSPIDVALEARGGVCQDFSHIMLALLRGLGMPSRYVSGYLARNLDADSGERSVEDESHAWVEAWLPTLGWVGFDPTNNLVVSDRHVRVAVGRDYADVPPTRGVFIGSAETELNVGVYIGKTDAPAPDSAELLPTLVWQPPPKRTASMWQAQQQQQ